MGKFRILKSTSMLECNTWEKNQSTGEIVNKVILEMSNSLPGSSKGVPEAGSKKYDYNNKIKISFNLIDMAKCAYHLKVIAFGGSTEYKKYGDMSKVSGSNSTEKKSLTIKNNDKGQAQIFLSSGKENSVTLYLDKDEAYAMSEWFKITFSKLNDNYQED